MDTSVLIIGAGPVGLTMAHKLAAYGVKVRIIDKNQGPTQLSKALVIWQRTLEVLDSTLNSRRFLEHSQATALHGMLFRTPTETIGQVDLKGSESAQPTGLFLPQSATEEILVDELKRQGIEVERDKELISFEQHKDHVHSTIESASGGQESITSAWIIGTDGAHSKVRHGLNLPFEGNTIERRWLLADISVAEAQNPHFMQAYLSDEGIVGFFPIGPKRWRVIVDGGDSERKGDPSQEEIQAIIDQRAGDQWKIVESFWLSEFVINERLVPQYRVNRAFLAGDAAHVHSPAGGQGMNTGIQDATNLAWKLALVQNAGGSEKLLESYHEERHLIGQRVVAETSQMVHMAMVHHPLVRRLRDFAMRHITRTKWFSKTMKPKVSEIDLSYRAQSLAQRSPKRSSALHAGDRLPQLVEGGSFIYQQLQHPGATLLTVGADEAELPLALGTSPSALPLQHIRLSPGGELAAQLGIQSGGVAWIRPDAYVGAIATRSKDLRNLLKELSLDSTTE